MSDGRLRTLERAWKNDGNGDNAVAYLAELLRTGEVRRTECVLAWRLDSVERLLQRPGQDLIPMGGRELDPQNPGMAIRVLRVLFGPPVSLSNRHLVGDTGPEGASVSVGAIGDVVRSVLMSEGVIQNQLRTLEGPAVHMTGGTHGCSACGFGAPGQRGHFPGCPRLACQPGQHLGPIDYDVNPPRCDRCGELFWGCCGGTHGPTRETTAGTACTICGEVVTPVRSGP